MGPSRSGPRGGTGPWGQYKTPDMLGSIRAQRGRARSALFHRVFCYFLYTSVKIKILCEIWMSWQMLLVIAWNFFKIFFFKKDWYDLQGFKQKKCNSFDGCPNEKYQLILTGPKKNWRTQNLFQFLLRSDVLGDAGCQMVLLKWLEGKVCSFKRRR